MRKKNKKTKTAQKKEKITKRKGFPHKKTNKTT